MEGIMAGKINRVIWIVLDSVGMGDLPDSAEFGDAGCHTIGNLSAAVGGLRLPQLVSLGLGNIDGMKNIPTSEELHGTEPIGCYGRLAERSRGKDTTIGHWEMMGIYSPSPFPVYPNGFPDEIIDEFVRVTGVPGILCNEPASGTVVIERFGDEHKATGKPIIYTSADSVFQIAAHEAVIPLEKLYDMCRSARALLDGDNAVARVIARPFVDCASGASKYERTSNRRDFSLKPDGDNLMTHMKDDGLEVTAVGKIEDIFAGVGITKAIHTRDNMHGMDVTLEEMGKCGRGMIFTNLVEFDSKWGHRRDCEGYARGLLDFDHRLGELLGNMRHDDLLVITADHGCDPTAPGTDHTREYVPLLIYSKSIRGGVNLGTRESFADTGQTVAQLLGVSELKFGQGFAGLL